MRTFWTVLATFVVTLLLVGAGGYIYNERVSNTSRLTAEVNEWGHLEITSRSLQPVYVIGVAFNDRGMNECTPRPGPNFIVREYTAFNQDANRWTFHWKTHGRLRLEEGRTAIVPFDRACGDTIVKAVVVTDLGAFTYLAPSPSRDYRPNGGRVALYQDW